MSPEDQRAQKGAILLESQEVEAQISALLVRARRLGSKISEFGELLQTQPAREIMKEDQAHRNIAVNGPTSKETLAAMRGWQESFDIADQLRQAMNRAQELGRQKAQLGLK
jgi:hypothetical protein